MTGIIGAMEEEVTLLRDALQESRTKTIGSFIFYSGKLADKPVVLLRCGIGKVNAAAGCVVMIQEYSPDFVINTGSAGGIDPSLSFGDAIISDGLVQHDVDVTAFGYAPGQIPKMPAVFPAAENLIALAEQAIEDLKQERILPPEFNHVQGLIGSADVFMHESDRIAALRKTFPAIRAVEMEGAAIAQACYLFSVPALIIRALSDIAGAESPMKSEEFLPLAAKNSAEIVRRIISLYKRG
ncbi:5'-methylthioadenosine/S-adenosylhomocysteine nucleosidase [Spirochaetia bacterium]|nr:5'-methylthioadenosine/S-adenosylhomocysteine nucleosidase [Spirochaetia bacterium]